MNKQIIKIEADSLAEAEGKVNATDYIILEKSVLCSGRVETVEEIAASVEEALVRAKSRVPPEAEIEKEEIRFAPGRTALKAEGYNEESALKELVLNSAELVESIVLHKKGRKGFLGFFRRPGVYEVTVFQQALVEIRFRVKARLQVVARSYLAEDLLRSAHELRRKNAQWAELLRFLNPKNDEDIQRFLVQLRGSYSSDLPFIFNLIEDVCCANEKANWKKAITDIYWRAQDELNKQKVRLRSLDVEIAEAFMFYTSIDWSEKDYSKRRKEPTGLPRTGFGKEHIPTPTLRETIPRYSTDEKAFNRLRKRIDGFELSERYLECLAEEALYEKTATFEQKCRVGLKVRRERQKGER
jgi:hypothetical protein